MKNLLKITIFLIIGIIPLSLLYRYLVTKDYMPILSDRMSYDAKIQFAIQQDVQDVDVIAVGSSVTLNNLHSQRLTEYFGPDRPYFNFASWGLKMTHHLAVMPTYLKRYHPTTVIMASAPRDFMKMDVPFQEDMFLAGYLNEWYPYFFLLRPNLRELRVRNRWRQSCRQDQSTFSSLNYDEWGGVIFQIPDSNDMRQERWDQASILDVAEEQYQALDQLCTVLAENQIQFIFVQSFVKNANCATPDCQQQLEAHIARIKQIVEDNNHTFINMYPQGLQCPDSLFADDIHLNFDGPEYFTKQLLEEMNSQGVALK